MPYVKINSHRAMKNEGLSLFIIVSTLAIHSASSYVLTNDPLRGHHHNWKRQNHVKTTASFASSWSPSDEPELTKKLEDSLLNRSRYASSSALTQPDSVEQFADDVTTVLKSLRKEDRDPTLPKLFRDAPIPSFCHVWSLKDWDYHTSRWRYLRVLVSFPRSRLLRRIFPQLAVVGAWSFIVCWLFARETVLLNRLSLSLTPLSLISTFVAALLTLRSNQGLERLNMGRLAFGKVVLYTRDLASLIVSNIYPKDAYLAIKLLRHVSLFGWLLKGFLRGDQMNGSDDDLVHTMLDPVDAAYVLSQRKKPMAVIMRLRQAFQFIGSQHHLRESQAIALDHATAELNECLMTTERIRASPIPPLYTSHTGRLLLFYLFFLPLGLRGMLTGPGTVVTTLAVAYAMLGLDEISFLLEQPFRLMPLFQLCKNAMMDVSDALVIPQPSLQSPDNPTLSDSSLLNQVDSDRGPFVPPSYW